MDLSPLMFLSRYSAISQYVCFPNIVHDLMSGPSLSANIPIHTHPLQSSERPDPSGRPVSTTPDPDPAAPFSHRSPRERTEPPPPPVQRAPRPGRHDETCLTGAAEGVSRTERGSNADTHMHACRRTHTPEDPLPLSSPVLPGLRVLRSPSCEE